MDVDFKWGIQLLYRKGVGLGFESIFKDKLIVNKEEKANGMIFCSNNGKFCSNDFFYRI